MASVVKSWIRILCPRCRETCVFHLRPGWMLACSACGYERPLGDTMGSDPRRRVRSAC